VNFNKIEKYPIIIWIIIIIYYNHALQIQLYTWNEPYSYAIYCSSYSDVRIYGT